MKRTNELVPKFVLPLTIILFGTITKWRYVYVEDGPDHYLYGFPLTYICSGWHTSMTLQIFILELLFDFSFYFIICFTVVNLIDRFVKPIFVKKYLTYVLYGLTTIIVLLYGLYFSNPDNVFQIKRDFNYKEIQNGYKFMWQQDKR